MIVGTDSTNMAEISFFENNKMCISYKIERPIKIWVRVYNIFS